MSINQQSKRKTSYAKRSLKTKQHTTLCLRASKSGAPRAHDDMPGRQEQVPLGASGSLNQFHGAVLEAVYGCSDNNALCLRRIELLLYFHSFLSSRLCGSLSPPSSTYVMDVLLISSGN